MHFNHAFDDQIGNAVRYAKQYTTKMLPEWVLSKYIGTLSELVEIADSYYITLQPETIYLDSRDRVDPHRMVDAVEEVFPYGDKHGRRMNVNDFMTFVTTQLPQSVFERRNGRPMQAQEKELSLRALDAVRMLRDLQNIFSNIESASPKYQKM